ncbi:Alpha/Beta hydrolase protein [Phyllosticta citricarpa]|uniref:Alpha/Beta hydrolase protein n=2 Tax=Phyllosticta TaxID=121621 RepID=A0ABR1MEC7_9PEZI
MAPRPPSADLKLHLSDYIRLSWILCIVVIKTMLALLAVPFTTKRAPGLTRHLMYTALRAFTAHADSRLEQGLVPGTDESYADYCRIFKCKQRFEILEDGTRAYWMGSKTARNVMLYLHGGGYAFPISNLHFKFLHYLIDDVNEKDTDALSILVLHYDTTPFGTYPRQLAQSAALLNYVRKNLGIPANRLFVSGDSAGGNLVMSLLSHLMHPHPDHSVPTVELDKGEKLKGAALICPMTSFDLGADSFQRNKTLDVIDGRAGLRWVNAYLGGKPHDPYNEPACTPEGWWKNLANVCRDVYHLIGGNEVMLDHEVLCYKKIEKEWAGDGEIRVEIIPGEGHVACATDLQGGYDKEDIKTYTAVRDWFKMEVQT